MKSQPLRLLDLLQSCDWASLCATGIFEGDYGEGESQKARYAEIYEELCSLEPAATGLSIQVERVFEDPGKNVVHVFGIGEPGRGVVNDWEFGVNEEGKPWKGGIEGTDWAEWIAMPVTEASLEAFTKPQIVAHCLYEMTFSGWYRGENLAFVEHLIRYDKICRRNKVMQYHAFLCHASEDKEIARKIFEYLEAEGYKIWFDEIDLALGDSIRTGIDRGLSKATYGIILLSPAFFAKNWTQYELDGLVARQMEGGQKVILPVWHNITMQELLAYSPPLAALKAISTDEHPRMVAYKIIEVLNPPRIVGT
jgi:hypothetical protein